MLCRLKSYIKSKQNDDIYVVSDAMHSFMVSPFVNISISDSFNFNLFVTKNPSIMLLHLKQLYREISIEIMKG